MTKEERLQRDKDRLAAMRGLDDEIRARGFKYVAGIDEVGRGPLAGPVYAACVVLPDDFDVLGIYDSKKLSAKKREELSDIIKERSIAYGIGIADNSEIDEINILEATKLAMERAIEECSKKLCLADKMGISKANAAIGGVGTEEMGAVEARPDFILIDALKLEVGIPCEAIVKGDEKSLSIAAASIVAKVARDKYMEELDSQYPGYDFASNKGYGTVKHYEGLRTQGITPIHRRSFLKKFEENPNTGHSSPKSTTEVGVGAAETAGDTAGEENKVGKKVYAVKKGKTPGLYMTWEDCKAQVDGFAGAEYKSFADPQDAMAYLGLAEAKEERFPEGVRAYVDGSYDQSTNRFSCGVVIVETDAAGNDDTTELKAVFEDDVAALQRNVAGEIMGAKTAIDYCLQNDIRRIEIYHDYEGVGKWADGKWKANNPLTQAYKQFVAEARQKMSITFVKVKAHAGNKYNELADKLAKRALDLH